MSHDAEARFVPEPNVTPMIDVLLVLLIIFMVAIKPRRHMDAQLPQPSTERGEGVQIVLEVDPGPVYRLNQQPVASGALLERLRGVYEGRPERTLLVRGSRLARYQDVITAMDVARSAGVTVIGIPTTPMVGER
ncbi:MAG TPA: biopolymer transporter ExbD [Gemmatimonadaceae bacterium]|nr:biopolymer transporter ExbD [Gemmatimonadaceae bacterium]